MEFLIHKMAHIRVKIYRKLLVLYCQNPWGGGVERKDSWLWYRGESKVLIFGVAYSLNEADYYI